MRDPAPSQPLRAHVGALLVLLVYGFLFTMGAPGFDYMNINHYEKDQDKAKIIEESPVWGRIVVALYAVNREVRRPLMEHLKPIERSFRIAQDWNLYRDGPSRVRRLEVYVDGELKHRSADPDYTWLNPQLRNRKIRPALENAARKSSTVNWPGIVRFLVEEALEDFPGTTLVEVHATWSPFPGTKPEFHHGFKAAAPDWEVVPIPFNEIETRQAEEGEPVINPWKWWVARCQRPVDARPVALVRVLLPLTILGDLLRVAQIGQVFNYYVPYAAGGINKGQDSMWKMDQLLADEIAGPATWVVATICMALASAGIAVRPAILIGVAAYSQLGHCYPIGDRGIDRFVRTILLILLFSGTHKRFVPWAKEKVATIPAWSSDLIKFAMVMMYMAAGISKLMQQPRWLAADGTPVVYRIMTDPMAAHLDPVLMQSFFTPLRAMGWMTIALECSAFLLLTRAAPYWAVFGFGMHLGIAVTMELGMFSYSMMSLYPILFAPWLLKAMDRMGIH